MLDDGRLLSIDKVLPVGEISRLEFDSIVGTYMNESAGLEFMKERRAVARGDIPVEHFEYSARIDMFNLMHTVVVNEMAEGRCSGIMTSHGLLTLAGWRTSWIDKTKPTPFQHSMIALYLTRAWEKLGRVDEAKLLFDAAYYAVKAYRDELRKIGELRSWVHTGMPPSDVNMVVSLSRRGMTTLRYWKEEFEGTVLQKREQ